jgi:hypothetical protein
MSVEFDEHNQEMPQRQIASYPAENNLGISLDLSPAQANKIKNKRLGIIAIICFALSIGIVVFTYIRNQPPNVNVQQFQAHDQTIFSLPPNAVPQ